MKKLIAMVALLGSVAALSACAGSGSATQDETLTQAPYAENRTVGPQDGNVRSAEPVFEKRQVK
jgi:hypothetical protein